MLPPSLWLCRFRIAQTSPPPPPKVNSFDHNRTSTPAKTKFTTTSNHGVTSDSHNTSAATINRLITAIGSSPFQAKAINWSTRNLGRVARTHTITENTAKTLIKNHIIGGNKGPCQPPRNSVEIMQE